MSDIKDFVIENGVLMKYTGNETNVVIPEGVTSIGGWAFSRCTGLTNIEIPDSVTSIGGAAFSECTGLTSVTIGNSVTSIGDMAFSGCTSLTSITIPDSVTSIGGAAFSECTGLTSVTIPDSVTSIGNDAFSGCTGLTSIKVNEGNPNYDSRHNCNAIIKTSTNSLIAGCKNTVIPDSVTSIGYLAFDGCTGLTSVTIPNGVTSIGNFAFYNCTGLTSVTIGNSVTSIGDRAFSGCTSLTSITIPDSVKIFDKSISTYPLYIKNKPLSKITSFDKKLCLFGFVDNEGYKNESKEVIDSYIKYAKSQKKKLYLSILNQKNLLQFMIECNIIPLADFDLVFDIVKNNIELSALLLEYKNNNFTPQDEMKLFEKKLNTNPLSTQELKKVWGVRKNPDGTLCITSYKGFDTEVVVPESIGKSKVTTIGYLAFSPQAERITSEISNSRKNITQITIPNSVISIDDAAFKGCTSLTNISIPDSVTSIGDRAFADCENLTSITIPDSVTNIGRAAFFGCENLTSITIPDSVTNIGGAAFFGCENLTSITIPNSVKSIGDSAFGGCENLTSITIPNSVKSIGDSAFGGCERLTNVTIPDSVTSIGEDAFRGCKRLKNVTIPDSVTSIGRWAFYGTSMYNNFSNWHNDVLYIGKYLIVAKKTLSGVYDIKNDTICVANSAFKNCKRLTSVVVPNSVTNIGEDAFSGCTSLTSITIPDSVTSIGDFAFYGCKDLIIHAPAGSFAEQYAKENGISFIAE